MNVLSYERLCLGKDRVVADRADHEVDREYAKREAEIADAVDDESLDRRRVRLRLLVPEADQQVAREPDPLPAEEQLDEIVGCHEHKHREREQGQIREESRLVRVV